MPLRDQSFRRSSIKLYVPYPDADSAFSAEESCVIKTVKMFAIWFGDTEVEVRYCSHEEGGFETVYIVCSYCTTERLKANVLEAISFARELARELMRDRLIMVINNNSFDIKPI